MPDYSQYGIPRPVDVGREIRVEQRRNRNRAVIFAGGGVLLLCVCLCTAVLGAVFILNPAQPSGRSTGLMLPLLSGPAATPTDSKPTAVPYLKTGKNGAGLRVSVSAYQRPLPAGEGVKIPSDQELALVSIRIENTRTTGGPIKYTPEDFTLVTPEGDTFAAETQGLMTSESLKKGELAPGKSTKGDLIFYVYKDVQDVFLAWASVDGSVIEFQLRK